MDIADHTTNEYPLVLEHGPEIPQEQHYFPSPVEQVAPKASRTPETRNDGLILTHLFRPAASIGKSRRLRLDSKGSHPCPYALCQRSFSTKYNAKAHLRVHTDEKPFICSLGCGECFKWGSSKKNHQANKCPLRKDANAVDIHESVGPATYTNLRSMEPIPIDTAFQEDPETDLSMASSAELKQNGVSVSGIVENDVSRSNEFNMVGTYQNGPMLHGNPSRLVHVSHGTFLSYAADARVFDTPSNIDCGTVDSTNTAIPLPTYPIDKETNVMEGLKTSGEGEEWDLVKSCDCALPCHCSSISPHWEINGAFF